MIIIFYEKQPDVQKNEYKQMLTILGNLSLLFSESDCPYLSYRAHENIFCKYFETENIARLDYSADTKKEKLGIGLKTWMGSNDQKIAEFGRLRENYKDLVGLELVKTIANYRNERIRVTMNLHGLDKMIYHIVKRIPNEMQIIEYSLEFIDIKSLQILKNRGQKNNTYFTDKKHIYHFSISKNTLYMIFENCVVLDTFNVEIKDDPYSYLLDLSSTLKIPNTIFNSVTNFPNKLCLRLYSSTKKKGKFIPAKSGLNQWNASGRKRDPNEIYISYPKDDRKRSLGFFPPRETVFSLLMPDGQIIQAKVCQDDGKAIMSNPNKILGKWLLRTVFCLPPNTLITYEMLVKFGVDSVIFTKLDENKYKIDFADIGTYEDFIENQDQNNND